MVVSLIELFEDLHVPDTASDKDARFSAHPIPDYQQHKIAKNTEGFPCLLIAVRPSDRFVQSLPVELENLTVLHNIKCRVLRPDGYTEQERYTVICCTVSNRELQTYFLRVAQSLIASIGGPPTQQEIGNAVDKLIELFRALVRPSRKAVQGLWAELFVIVQSRDPIRLVEAWHQTPEDRYDFSVGTQRIEVKSVLGRQRQHHFSFEQLHPPMGTTVLIASVFVERAGSGTSTEELVARLLEMLNDRPDLILQVEYIGGLTLGVDWYRATQDRFDYELANDSLRFYEASAVPSVTVCPDGVSDVRFRSDLTNVPIADQSTYRKAGGILGAVFHR